MKFHQQTKRTAKRTGDGGEGGGDELPCATEGEGGEDCV